MDFASSSTRTDAERDWSEFVRWIGYADLAKAIERKMASLNDAMSFKDIVPKLFEIEIGLSQILHRWKTTRALPFPKNKPIYDAYSFIASANAIRSCLNRQ